MCHEDEGKGLKVYFPELKVQDGMGIDDDLDHCKPCTPCFAAFLLSFPYPLLGSFSNLSRNSFQDEYLKKMPSCGHFRGSAIL